MNSPIPVSHARVAVLVDGENIGCALSSQIQERAQSWGAPKLWRVYGNANATGDWEGQPGFKFVHTPIGKNSADMKLAIDAMELACDGAVDRFVLVTSDGDFTHLAYALVERGLRVLGLGGCQAPEMFREACSEFVQVGPDRPPVTAVQSDVPKNRASGLTANLLREIGQAGPGGIEIASLNGLMRPRYGVKISSYTEKTWRGYFSKRNDKFVCDDKGPQARVRLKKTENANT